MVFVQGDDELGVSTKVCVSVCVHMHIYEHAHMFVYRLLHCWNRDKRGKVSSGLCARRFQCVMGEARGGSEST